MKRLLVTGAAGGIGGHLRRLLPPIYPDIVWSDMKQPADLKPNETFVKADIRNPDEVAKLMPGVEGIVHLGGISGEAPWEAILAANISGCYNVFEAARVAGVKRVIFASSNHAVGFYPRATKIGTKVIARPDSRYGVSKHFGEGLGALYAYKHGIGVTSLRIGNVNEEPIDPRRLAIWLKPEDLVQLIRIGLERPGLVYEVMYGVSDNERSWYDNSHARSLAYRPEGRSADYAAKVIGSGTPAKDEPSRVLPRRHVLRRRVHGRFQNHEDEGVSGNAGGGWRARSAGPETPEDDRGLQDGRASSVAVCRARAVARLVDARAGGDRSPDFDGRHRQRVRVRRWGWATATRGIAPRKPEPGGLAGWVARRRLCAGSSALGAGGPGLRRDGRRRRRLVR